MTRVIDHLIAVAKINNVVLFWSIKFLGLDLNIHITNLTPRALFLVHRNRFTVSARTPLLAFASRAFHWEGLHTV